MTAANKALVFCSYRADIAETHTQNLVVWPAELRTVEFIILPSFSRES